MAEFMAEKDSPETCICRNIRLKDAVVFYLPDGSKFAWHKQCPVHRFIMSEEIVEPHEESRKAKKVVDKRESDM
jgi:nitrite reductase/ring-hydroxylating ferredoxin subunit